MDLKNFIKNNPAVLLSEKQVRALLCDAFLNDQLKVNLMMNAFSIGIITEMRESFPVDHFTVTRWSKKLVTEYGVSDNNARWAIDTWISAISTQILHELDEAEKQASINEEAKRRKREEEALLLAEAARKRQEEEEAAREQKRRNTPDRRLKTKDDFADFYINPSLEVSKDYIYVPCGYGQGDNGFLIHGIKKENLCKHSDANIYALIYNYLTRSSIISKDNIPKYLKDMNTVYELDYQAIYRIAITLLQMIHHNMFLGDVIVLNYVDDFENLNYAVRMINHYAALFCRLIGIRAAHLQVKTGKAGIPFSVDKKTSGVYITDNTRIVSNARELWFGRKINYHLTKENLADLEYILNEISDFDGFKEGQFSALCDMLACKKHAVCIMPTGSGKSLIFYMASLLQPLPLFIVAPTDILIQDQIRNLKMFHHMDNVAHLQLTGENSFSNWEICNSLNYLTPMAFQNRNLLVKFRYLNAGTKLVGMHDERVSPGASVSYVVLDEIHCLSNWGHDFRPEYLMLSKYLNKFFDHITFWGFTATANYTVVEDVQKQLNIPQENFFSPIAFERFNVSYDYRVYHSEREMLDGISDIIKSLVSRNERTIVFTKSDSLSEKVAEAIGWEADIFSIGNPAAYYHFAAGESKVLVASNEIGIGINLPNIRNVIHFGLPLSKNEYVQEIGRAGRANEKVKSYVLYLDSSQDNVPAGLLKRNTPIHSLPMLLDGYDNDYSDAYRKLSNGAVSDEELYDQLIQTYQDFVRRGCALTVDSYPYGSLDKAKQQLYMLYLTGFVYDWYSYSQSKDGNGVDILVDICAADTNSYRSNPTKMLNRMKERMHDYYVYMGNSRESIAKVERANSPEEIIRVYVKWYYEKYLYHHNEQFIDLFEFIETYAACDSDRITEAIKDYFVLPFAKLKNDEALINELSPKEIIAKTTSGVSRNTLINLERINSNRYSYKLDLALFCGQLRMNDLFDESRLCRVLSKLPDNAKKQLANSLAILYPSCSTLAKIRILNFMERDASSLRTTYMGFLKSAYHDGQKDEIYYGIMASILNKHYTDMRRSAHV